MSWIAKQKPPLLEMYTFEKNFPCCCFKFFCHCGRKRTFAFTPLIWETNLVKTLSNWILLVYTQLIRFRAYIGVCFLFEVHLRCTSNAGKQIVIDFNRLEFLTVQRLHLICFLLCFFTSFQGALKMQAEQVEQRLFLVKCWFCIWMQAFEPAVFEWERLRLTRMTVYMSPYWIIQFRGWTFESVWVIKFSCCK